MLLDETPLFEPALLQELDWSSKTVSFSPPISPSQPGEGLVLRPLCTADFNRGKEGRATTTHCFIWVVCIRHQPEENGLKQERSFEFSVAKPFATVFPYEHDPD